MYPYHLHFFLFIHFRAQSPSPMSVSLNSAMLRGLMSQEEESSVEGRKGDVDRSGVATETGQPDE